VARLDSGFYLDRDTYNANAAQRFKDEADAAWKEQMDAVKLPAATTHRPANPPTVAPPEGWQPQKDIFAGISADFQSKLDDIGKQWKPVTDTAGDWLSQASESFQQQLDSVGPTARDVVSGGFGEGQNGLSRVPANALQTVQDVGNVVAGESGQRFADVSQRMRPDLNVREVRGNPAVAETLAQMQSDRQLEYDKEMQRNLEAGMDAKSAAMVTEEVMRRGYDARVASLQNIAATPSITAGAPMRGETLTGGADYGAAVAAGTRYNETNPTGAFMSGILSPASLPMEGVGQGFMAAAGVRKIKGAEAAAKAAAEAELRQSFVGGAKGNLAAGEITQAKIDEFNPKMAEALRAEVAGTPPVEPPRPPTDVTPPPPGEPPPPGGGRVYGEGHPQGDELMHWERLGYQPKQDEPIAQFLDRTARDFQTNRAVKIPVQQSVDDAVQNFGLLPDIVKEVTEQPDGYMARNVQILDIGWKKAGDDWLAAQKVLDNPEGLSDDAIKAAQATQVTAAARKVEIALIATRKYSAELGRGLHALQGYADEIAVKAADQSATIRTGRFDNSAKAIRKAAETNGKMSQGELDDLAKTVDATEAALKGEGLGPGKGPGLGAGEGGAPGAGGATKPRTKPTPSETAEAMNTVKEVDANTNLWRRYIDLNRELGESRLPGSTRTTEAIEAERVAVRDELYAALEEKMAQPKKGKPGPETPEELANAAKDKMASGIRSQWAAEIKGNTTKVTQVEGDVTTLAQSKLLGETSNKISAQIDKDLATWNKDVATQVTEMETAALKITAKERIERIREFIRAGGNMKVAAQVLEDVRALSTEGKVAAKQFKAEWAQATSMKAVGSEAWKKLPQEERDNLITQLLRTDSFTDPRSYAKFASALAKPTLWDRIHLYRIWSMLSGPPTLVLNAMGTAGEMAFAIPARAVEGYQVGGKGLAGQLVKDEWAGWTQGLDAAVNEFAATMKTGYSGRPIKDVGRHSAEAIPFARDSKKAMIANMPLRFMAATDDFWRTMNFSGALRAEARLESFRTGKSVDDILLNLTDYHDVVQRAEKAALRRTYQQEAGYMTRGVNEMRRNPIGQTIIPFFNTIMNLARIGAERTPYGFLEASKLAKKGNVAEAATMRAEATLGSMALIPVAGFAAAGNITGYGPTDPQERADWMDQGGQPYSIKIGDRWVSYANAGSVMIPLAITASTVEAVKNGMSSKDATEALIGAIHSYSNLFLNVAALRGLSDSINAMTDPTRYGDRMVNALAVSMSPASGLLASISRMFDPEIKDVQNLGQAFEARTPIASKNVPPILSQLGQPAVRGSAGAEAMLPFRSVQERPSPVLQEYQNLRGQGQDVGIGHVGGAIENVQLTPTEAKGYDFLAGKFTDILLSQEMAKPEYKALSPMAKAKRLTEVRDIARERARNIVVTAGGQDFAVRRGLTKLGLVR
jgi:hypothetical protein